MEKRRIQAAAYNIPLFGRSCVWHDGVVAILFTKLKIIVVVVKLS